MRSEGSGRLPHFIPAVLNDAQLELYREIRASRGDKVVGEDRALRGPFNALMLEPVLGGQLQQIGQILRFQGVLPDRVRELAILVVAADWRCSYEWVSHKPLAVQAGVPELELDQLWHDQTPSFGEPDCRLICRATQELLRVRELSDETYGRLIEAFGRGGIFEFFVLVGYYSLLAGILNGFEIVD